MKKIIPIDLELLSEQLHIIIRLGNGHPPDLKEKDQLLGLENMLSEICIQLETGNDCILTKHREVSDAGIGEA